MSSGDLHLLGARTAHTYPSCLAGLGSQTQVPVFGRQALTELPSRAAVFLSAGTHPLCPRVMVHYSIAPADDRELRKSAKECGNIPSNSPLAECGPAGLILQCLHTDHVWVTEMRVSGCRGGRPSVVLRH